MASEIRLTVSEPKAWITDIQQIGHSYHEKLLALLSNDITPEKTDAARKTLAPKNWLATINKIVTIFTLSVGVLLLAGFFTRVAATAGVLFLLSVIAGQPPWVAGAAPIHYQLVELLALALVGVVGAGRWGRSRLFLLRFFQ